MIPVSEASCAEVNTTRRNSPALQDDRSTSNPPSSAIFAISAIKYTTQHHDGEKIVADIQQDSKLPASSDAEPNVPYSVLTLPQRRLVVCIAALAAMFSPLSSFIYYPALDKLALDLNTTVSKINLTITSYMVVSGIAPTMWGDLADQLGRRLVFMAMFTIYIGANIGLALQRSFAALLALRMLQSLGGSATVGVGYGMIGDIITPAERGQWMSIAALGPNVTPALGPVFGGLLAEKAGWPYIFWLLVILGSTALVLIIVFLPETSRKIVGNGSRAPGGLNIRLIDVLTSRSPPARREATRSRQKFRLPNPLLSLTLLLKPHNTPIMVIYGIFYTNYCVLQASLSTLFVNNYGFTSLDAGLTYIPFGVGCFLAALFGGRILNRDYRITAAKYGWDKVDKVVGDDLMRFPIIEARLRSMPVAIVLTVVGMVPFGFMMEHRVHLAGPLVLQFLLGTVITFTFSIINTLLVDLHPKRSATAQASVNLFRCAMAGGGLAALQPLIDSVGAGWCFVLFSGLTLTSLGLWWIENRWGWGWWKRSSDARSES